METTASVKAAEVSGQISYLWQSASRRLDNFIRKHDANRALSEVFLVNGATAAKILASLATWTRQSKNFHPKLVPLDDQILNPAVGAFSRDTETIYLARNWFADPAVSSEAKVRVLLEELGHWIDSRFCDQETPGDEGAHFAAVVMGDALSFAERPAQ
jgi:hypothetical protein